MLRHHLFVWLLWVLDLIVLAPGLRVVCGVQIVAQRPVCHLEALFTSHSAGQSQPFSV